MTSKKCLNKIQHHINGTELSGKELLECYETIYKDLDRLENLEKENQDLKDKNSLITKAIESDVSNGELFKSMAMLLHMKIEKLEKAIEILKERFDFNFNDEDKVIYLFIKGISLHIYSWCFKSQQKYELLKEVLE